MPSPAPYFDLIREFDLPLSHGALERIWRAHGLLHQGAYLVPRHP